MAPSFNIRVNEKSTFLYTGTLVNEQGAVLGPSDLTGMTITLYDKATGAIINNRDNQPCLNQNQWTLAAGPAGGNLIWDCLPEDNPIINGGLDTEVHIALLRWTYGLRAGDKEIAIRVVNLNKVS